MKRKVFVISEKLLCEKFKDCLPSDSIITGISNNPEQGTIHITLHSETCDDLPEGCHPLHFIPANTHRGGKPQ